MKSIDKRVRELRRAVEGVLNTYGLPLSIDELVLEGLQRLLWYIQVYERRFAQEQMERFGLQEKKALTAKRRNWTRPNSG